MHIKLIFDDHKVIYTTHLEGVVSTGSTNTKLTAEMEPCNHMKRVILENFNSCCKTKPH